MDQAVLALVCIQKNPNISSAIMGALKLEQVFKSVKALDLLPRLTRSRMLGNKGLEPSTGPFTWTYVSAENERIERISLFAGLSLYFLLIKVNPILNRGKYKIHTQSFVYFNLHLLYTEST